MEWGGSNLQDTKKKLYFFFLVNFFSTSAIGLWDFIVILTPIFAGMLYIKPLEVAQNRSSLSQVLIFSGVVFVIYSASHYDDHRRDYTANLIHTMPLPNPSGLEADLLYSWVR